MNKIRHLFLVIFNGCASHLHCTVFIMVARRLKVSWFDQFDVTNQSVIMIKYLEQSSPWQARADIRPPIRCIIREHRQGHLKVLVLKPCPFSSRGGGLRNPITADSAVTIWHFADVRRKKTSAGIKEPCASIYIKLNSMLRWLVVSSIERDNCKYMRKSSKIFGQWKEGIKRYRSWLQMETNRRRNLNMEIITDKNLRFY